MRLTILAALACLPAVALTPDQVALFVNQADADSARVAEHYRALRGVPSENIATFDLPAGETLSRADYEARLLPAARDWLAVGDRSERIRCLLLIYGMPLRVSDRPPSPEAKTQADAVAAELEAGRAGFEALQAELKALQEATGRNPEQEARLAELRPRVREMEAERRRRDAERRRLLGGETQASLDSELALCRWPEYELYRWMVNPLHFMVPAELRAEAPPVYCTARLDGANAEAAMRLVTDAVRIEREGLRGKAYIDARGLAFDAAAGDWYGYSGYDESLRDLARLLDEKTDLEEVLDDRPELFAPGACPEVALYCGWYRVGHYLDAFEMAPGAVGYHIASFEAATLRGETEGWCRGLLDDGIAATLGPVAEPYLHAFPKPYEFFAQLLSGRTTLAETYAMTAALQSWMMTLIGDPLYNPFGAHPLLAPEELRTSPPGAPSILRAE